MFAVKPHQYTEVLRFFSERLDSNEIEALSQEAGFTDPNNFPIFRIIDPIKQGHYPTTDHFEYCWAIYECDIKRIERYSRPLKCYLSSIYTYCNKIRQWGTVIESDYYYLVIQSELEEGVSEFSRYFLMFMEWMYEHVSSDEGYDDYYFLLAWLLLRRLRNDSSQELFENVMSVILKKQYSRERIEELTVSDRAIDSWLSLNGRIPSAYGYTAHDFVQIISGIK